VEVVIDNALAYSRGVLLTKAGRDALLSEEAAAKYPGAAVIAEHLFKTYEATPIRRPGLSGWTLARR
jgi:hypothetical protein